MRDTETEKELEKTKTKQNKTLWKVFREIDKYLSRVFRMFAKLSDIHKTRWEVKIKGSLLSTMFIIREEAH